MANQAQKKRNASAATTSSRLLKAIVAVNLWFFGIRFGYNGESFSTWQWVGAVFLTTVSSLMYKNIISSEIGGFSYDYYFDLFSVNLAVQAGSVYSEYAWLLYLSVPVYIGYRAGGYLLKWVFKPDAEPTGPVGTRAERRAAAKGK